MYSNDAVVRGWCYLIVVVDTFQKIFLRALQWKMFFCSVAVCQRGYNYDVRAIAAVIDTYKL